METILWLLRYDDDPILLRIFTHYKICKKKWFVKMFTNLKLKSNLNETYRIISLFFQFWIFFGLCRRYSYEKMLKYCFHFSLSRFKINKFFLACNRFFLLYSYRDLNFYMPKIFQFFFNFYHLFVRNYFNI